MMLITCWINLIICHILLLLSFPSPQSSQIYSTPPSQLGFWRQFFCHFCHHRRGCHLWSTALVRAHSLVKQSSRQGKFVPASCKISSLSVTCLTSPKSLSHRTVWEVLLYNYCWTLSRTMGLHPHSKQWIRARVCTCRPNCKFIF